jgi:tRNA(fMet)-specific endonuclease VapC
MGLVVDSSSLIAAERGDVDLDALLSASADEPVVMAAITASELLHGVHRLRGVGRARAELFVHVLLDRLPVVAFDLGVARVHASLAADLRSRGQAVGAHDLCIAATAVFLDYGVATRDLRSFPKIKGLAVTHW